MRVDIFNIDKFIKVNSLVEVTNPILFERDNQPTVDGLLSSEIFGRTNFDRSTIFAYIDLNGHFLHPLVYKTWKKLSKVIEAIVAGERRVSVNSRGELVDDPNGWTGVEELYNHYDKIKFPKKESATQQTYVDFMNSLDKDEAFCSKWLVLPAFYRDVQLDNSSSGVVSVHEKTKLYCDILRQAKSLKNNFSGIPMVTFATRNKIQQLLVSCWTDYFMKDIKGKNGIFRKYVMGKSVDYAARLVITAPMFDKDLPSNMVVDFEHSGVPLSAVCAMFYPYIIKWLKDYFYNEIELRKDRYPIRTKDGVTTVRLINTEKYDDDYFAKAINSYVKSYADRYKTIPLDNDQGRPVYLSITGKYSGGASGRAPEGQTDSSIMARRATWTDILFLAASSVVEDKMCLITRYPIEDQYGIFANKIRVLSTMRTVPVIISGKLYENYPDIDLTLTPEEVSSNFRESLVISNLYLAGLGGDYDGDQVTIRGIWDVNGNIEALNGIYAKKNLLNISGKIIRTTEKEAIQCIYCLTRDNSKRTKPNINNLFDERDVV